MYVYSLHLKKKHNEKITTDPIPAILTRSFRSLLEINKSAAINHLVEWADSKECSISLWALLQKRGKNLCHPHVIIYLSHVKSSLPRDSGHCRKKISRTGKIRSARAVPRLVATRQATSYRLPMNLVYWLTLQEKYENLQIERK